MSFDITSLNRSEIRKEIRQQRLDLSSEQQSQAATQLLTHFINAPKIQQAKNIALYLTNDGELDTQTLINWCWQQGKNIYLPVLHPFSKGHLLFLHYTKQTPLVANKYGIAEPKLNLSSVIIPEQLDLICTPLVAFDSTGNRLGMGGGFYDRTLSIWQRNFRLDKSAKPYPIGLAHNCQHVTNLPSENWDVPLPEVITPQKHYQFFRENI